MDASKSRRRKDTSHYQSKRRKVPLPSLNDHVASTPISQAEALESGQDRKLSPPPKPVVILALSNDTSAWNQRVQRRKSSVKGNSMEQKLPKKKKPNKPDGKISSSSPNADMVDGDSSNHETSLRLGVKKKSRLRNSPARNKANNSPSQDLMEKRCDSTEVKTAITSPNTGTVSEVDHIVDGASSCQVHNQEAPLGQSLEHVAEAGSLLRFSPDVNLSFRKKKRKSKAGVTRSTRLDENLISVSGTKLCDNQIPQENEGDSSKLLKTGQECEVSVVQTLGESPIKCEKDVSLTLLKTKSILDEPCSHTLQLMSEQRDPTKLTKEGSETAAQIGKSLSVDKSSENHPSKRSASRKRSRKDKMKTSLEGKASDELPALDISAKQPDCSSGKGTMPAPYNDLGNDVAMVENEFENAEPIKLSISQERAPILDEPCSHTLQVKSEQHNPSEMPKEGFETATQIEKTSVDESSGKCRSKISASRKRRRKDKTNTSHEAKAPEDLPTLDPSGEQPDFISGDCPMPTPSNGRKSKEIALSIEGVRNDVVMVDNGFGNDEPIKLSISSKRAPILDESCSHTLQVKSEHHNPSEMSKEGFKTATPIEKKSVDESSAKCPSKISASRKRRRKDETNTSHEAKAPEDLSTLDPSVEQPDFISGDCTMPTPSNGRKSKEIALSTEGIRNDVVMVDNGFGNDEPIKLSISSERAPILDESCSHTLQVKSKHHNPSETSKEGFKTATQIEKTSVDESSAKCPSKISASRKRRRKDKTNTSHEAKSPENLSTLDPSAEHPDFISGDCTMPTPSNGRKSKEIVLSIEGVRNDVVMVDNGFGNDELIKRPVSLERAPISHTQRKLLILDLNGLLVDIVSVLPVGYKADIRIARKALLKRPFCDDFLKFCFETFNVGVWSSRTKKNVDSVVDFIMGELRHKLLFCWDQSHCTRTRFETVEDVHKPLVLKEIRKLWNCDEPDLPWEKGEYDESNTLLLDDSPYKALLNAPHTALFPYSYECQNTNDNSLGPGGDLRMYLEGLAAAPHVQKYIEQHFFGQRPITSKNPSWGYYLKVINANNFSLPT